MFIVKVSDYDEFKVVLFCRYDMIEDGFKWKFYLCRFEVGEIFFQFIVRLFLYLICWIEMLKIDCIFEFLVDFMFCD